MDREFEQKAGETEESRRLRWSARLNNSLINNFRGEWPTNWNGRPFSNTFWLRNPTVLDERLMDYSAGRETGIAEAFAARAIELRGHFVENFDVQRHFADPARAWDEAFRANDGGVSYLVRSLIPVCDPAIKRAQVRGQLEVQVRRLVDRLAGFHSAADGDARLKKRDLVHTVLRGLATCIQQQLFGELVAGAHRLKLIDQLSLDVRALENAANSKWEEIAERQVRTAASALNGYVSALGFDSLPLEERPGLPPNAPTRRVFESPKTPDGAPLLAEDPAPIYADYCKDWMRAFLQLAMDNVGYEGGREITAEQNETLGAILRAVPA